MATNERRPILDLLGGLTGQLSSLFRQEVQLARTEVAEKVGQAGGAAASIAVGGVLLLAALMEFLGFVVALLVQLGLTVWLARLVVAVAVALIGYLTLRGGLSRLKGTDLTPHRTVEQLSRDAAVAKEQVR